jgi:pimeloyl-ACP methyl ester carboxylesterase
VELFLRELDALVAELGLDAYHVIGQSWVGILAMDHVLRHPPGLGSIVVADSPASIPLWVAEADQLHTSCRRTGRRRSRTTRRRAPTTHPSTSRRCWSSTPGTSAGCPSGPRRWPAPSPRSRRTDGLRHDERS